MKRVTRAWEKRSSDELIDHIVAHYHEALRREVDSLIEAAREVERTHAGKPGVPIGLADELHEHWVDMQQHMLKEEHVLFPMLSMGARGAQVYMPVRVMEHEHESQLAQLARIRQITGDLRAPRHACATWAELYRRLRAMESDLVEHIRLENDVLFPRATLDR